MGAIGPVAVISLLAYPAAVAVLYAAALIEMVADRGCRGAAHEQRQQERIAAVRRAAALRAVEARAEMGGGRG